MSEIFEREMAELSKIAGFRIDYVDSDTGYMTGTFTCREPRLPEFPDPWRSLRFRIAGFWLFFGLAMLWWVTWAK